MRKAFMCVALAFMGALHTLAKDVVDYVNPLVGTESKFELSTGNTYPAIAMPWGMNFWMPQTGRMGDGWAYVYWHHARNRRARVRPRQARLMVLTQS